MFSYTLNDYSGILVFVRVHKTIMRYPCVKNAPEAAGFACLCTILVKSDEPAKTLHLCSWFLVASLSSVKEAGYQQ